MSIAPSNDRPETLHLLGTIKARRLPKKTAIPDRTMLMLSGRSRQSLFAVTDVENHLRSRMGKHHPINVPGGDFARYLNRCETLPMFFGKNAHYMGMKTHARSMKLHVTRICLSRQCSLFRALLHSHGHDCSNVWQWQTHQRQSGVVCLQIGFLDTAATTIEVRARPLRE